MATDRSELTFYEWRQLRARTLAASDVCIVCGQGDADTADHVIPVSRGGARPTPTTSRSSMGWPAAPRASATGLFVENLADADCHGLGAQTSGRVVTPPHRKIDPPVSIR